MELIRDAKRGDLSATEMLFGRYQNSIFGYLSRMMPDRFMAEDATQETFLRAYRGLKRYKEYGSFKYWLFQIARREGLRILAREGNQMKRYVPGSVQGLEETTPDPDLLPVDHVISNQQQTEVEECIGMLPVLEREVVLLRMHQGLKFREIARITKSPLNTVLSRMHTAINRLRKMLHEEKE